jgi:hypothetical protein
MISNTPETGALIPNTEPEPMKLAVMQPYFFPYIGYFQLIAAADRFVVYDDVNYIKQGWINRNRILMNGRAEYISVPLKNASSFKSIRCTQIHENYRIWRQKTLSTLQTVYAKAPFFAPIFEMINRTLDAPADNISLLAWRSVQSVLDYLEIRTQIVPSSSVYGNEHLAGAERVINICQRERASTYINMAGGRELYSREAFSNAGLELRFLSPIAIEYKQFGEAFVPSLSIIDVLMFNDRSAARQLALGALIE